MDSNQAGGQRLGRRRVAWGQQQGWTGPENTWWESIKKWFPLLQTVTYFIPPFLFRRTPHSVDTVAGQVVRVRENHPPRPRRIRPPPPLPQPPPPQPPPPPLPRPSQLEGTLYVENPTHLQPVHVQDSDFQDDEAQELCFHSLSKIRGQAMIVVSQLKFRKYLDNLANPLNAARAQLPDARQLPSNLAEGECDVIIIHRTYGLVLGEIKSVGGSQHFSEQPPHQQNRIIVDKVDRALDQLTNQRTALKHLVSDLPNIMITLTLFLPNITYAQLSAALTTSPSLTQKLCQTLSTNNDVAQAVRRCLCKDLLKQPFGWWSHLLTRRSYNMPDLYERLVARFCGPATTVDVPTACPPRVVVRTLGQAVTETGLRFSSLNLTRTQVTLLNSHPHRPHHLYLQGPPGSGKTVVLFLGALQSVRQGFKVAIVHSQWDVAVATLLREQLVSILGAAAATTIHLHAIDFSEYGGLNVNADVASLQQQLGPDVHIIIDQVPFSGVDHHFIPWVTEVHNTWPQAVLWMAGLWIRDNTAPKSLRLPPWVEVETMQESLRCPPHVAQHVEQSGQGRVYIKDSHMPCYVSPAHPVDTDGPRVQELHHSGQHGHTGGCDDHLQCARCADDVANILSDLCVGQPGHPQYRDVWVLTGICYPAPRVGDVFVQRLQQQHHLGVRVVQTPLSDADARELALAVTDHIVVTHSTAVQGMERSVVIVLGYGLISAMASDMTAISRSTSFLCVID